MLKLRNNFGFIDDVTALLPPRYVIPVGLVLLVGYFVSRYILGKRRLRHFDKFQFHSDKKGDQK